MSDMQINKFSPLFNGTEKSKQRAVEKIELYRKIVSAFLVIFGLLLINASILLTFQDLFPDDFIFVIEDNPLTMGKLTYDNAIYFLAISITTIGYGDIYPETNLSRVIVILLLLCSLIILTMQTSVLSELIVHSQQYMQPYNNRSHKHVILAGYMKDISKLETFLTKFLINNNNGIKCVIIDNNEPNKEFLNLINLPRFLENIHFIKGNIFDPHILELADVKRAKAAFLFTYHGCKTQLFHCKDDHDEFVILASKTISNCNPEIKVYAQISKESEILHSWCNWSMAISFDDSRNALFCMNAFNPGFITFITNVFVYKENILRDDNPGSWFFDYSEGAKRRLFCKKVPKRLINEDFTQLAKKAYLCYHLIILGVYSAEYNEMLINPLKYTLKEDDDIVMIAVNKEHVKIFLQKHNIEEKMSDFVLENKSKFYDRATKTDLFKRKLKFTRNYDTHLPDIKLPKKEYNMLYDDLRGLVSDHIIVYGHLGCVGMVISYLRYFTSHYVVYVSENPPDTENWEKIKTKYERVLFAECSLSDPSELAKLAIHESKHSFIFSWKLDNSDVPDSGILNLVRIYQDNFNSAKFTVYFFLCAFIYKKENYQEQKM